jgi:hypothetical protein
MRKRKSAVTGIARITRFTARRKVLMPGRRPEDFKSFGVAETMAGFLVVRGLCENCSDNYRKKIFIFGWLYAASSKGCHLRVVWEY